MERANRDIALGRGNWTFFGSDSGGKTAAVLRSFVASYKRCGVEPFAWFNDVLSRVPAHSIARLTELLPHNSRRLPLVKLKIRGSGRQFEIVGLRPATMRECWRDEGEVSYGVESAYAPIC